LLRYSRIAIASSALLGGILFPFLFDSSFAASVAPVTRQSDNESAHFQISFHRGILTLNGHTVSAEHEQRLLHVAAHFFSGVETNSRFTRLDAVPDRWAVTTQILLEALSATQSAEAILNSRALRIRGVATSEWREQLKRLRATVSNQTELDVDVIVPDSRIRATNLCSRAVGSQKAGMVYFEESSTTFRSSAYGALEKTISLADACRTATIVITGHTDSSGYEPSNQRLSVARAELVADYFVKHGITRERLMVIGAGSSQPVADNAKRIGRSLNRRITIELRHDGASEVN